MDDRDRAYVVLISAACLGAQLMLSADKDSSAVAIGRLRGWRRRFANVLASHSNFGEAKRHLIAAKSQARPRRNVHVPLRLCLEVNTDSLRNRQLISDESLIDTTIKADRVALRIEPSEPQSEIKRCGREPGVGRRVQPQAAMRQPLSLCLGQIHEATLGEILASAKGDPLGACLIAAADPRQEHGLTLIEQSLQRRGIKIHL
jgi:hypothetical protein